MLLIFSKLNDLIKGAESAYQTAKTNQPNHNFRKSSKNIEKNDFHPINNQNIFSLRNSKDVSTLENNSISNVIKTGLQLSNRNVQKRDTIIKTRGTSNRAIISVSRDSKNSQNDEIRKIPKNPTNHSAIVNSFNRKQSQNYSLMIQRTNSTDKNDTDQLGINKENTKCLNLPNVNAFNLQGSNRSLHLSDANLNGSKEKIR